jgi:hypothetical protein
MKRYKIYEEFGAEVALRENARKVIQACIEVDEPVLIDFEDVLFISRSFAHELSSNLPSTAKIVNTDQKVEKMLSLTNPDRENRFDTSDWKHEKLTV